MTIGIDIHFSAKVLNFPIQNISTKNKIAAAVVRQPYNPWVKLSRWAVGLSHSGSRKKNPARPKLDTLVISQN